MSTLATSQHVVITLHATDEQTFRKIRVELDSPAGIDRVATAKFTLVSGTVHDGTWRTTLTIPRWVTPGKWTVALDLKDVGGGNASYNSRDSSWKATWPSQVSVSSVKDRTPPTLLSLQVSPKMVNTTLSAKTVRVRAVVRDGLSGVNRVQVSDGDGDWEDPGTIPTLHRISGTSKQGTYVGTFSIRRWLGAGPTLRPLSVLIRDNGRNIRFFDYGNLRSKGFDSAFTVRSGTEHSQPFLSRVIVSPVSLDATTAPAGKVVKIRLTATDTGSGIRFATAALSSRSGLVGDPRGNFIQLSPSVWLVSITIPQCSEPGDWALSVDLLDWAGNDRDYSSAQLARKGLPSVVHVEALDVQAPMLLVPKTVSHAGSLVIHISEPSLWSGAGPPVWVHDRTAKHGVTGTWACRNATGAVGCNDDGAGVVKATFTPNQPFVSGHHYSLLRPPDATAGVFDLSGNGPAEVQSWLYLFTAT